MEKYLNRQEAGLVLAKELESYANKPNTIVLALPRGGVPVAYEIAKSLGLPLDLLIVRKLGVPGHEELAMGAIASGDIVVRSEDLIRNLGLKDEQIQKVIRAEKEELKRRELLYRQAKAPINYKDKTVILVDDGIATGATMLAAVQCIAQQKPKELIIAVPVAAYASCKELANKVDKLICPLKPIDFYAVGLWYEDFSQTSDEEVAELLMKANQ